MTTNTSKHGWLARLRDVFPIFRRGHRFAQVSEGRAQNAQNAQKMTPIAKVLADAGRISATPAD